MFLTLLWCLKLLLSILNMILSSEKKYFLALKDLYLYLKYLLASTSVSIPHIMLLNMPVKNDMVFSSIVTILR